MSKRKAFGFNVAVRNLDEAVAKYKTLLEIEPKIIESHEFAFPGLRGACFDLHGFKINLITSVDKGTSIDLFLEKKGDGFFLFSLEVDDIKGEVERLREANFIFTPKDPVETEKWGKVIFIHPKSLNGIQLEMIQPKQ